MHESVGILTAYAGPRLRDFTPSEDITRELAKIAGEAIRLYLEGDDYEEES